MNLVILTGNLTRDPEIRVIDANGRKVSVAKFSIAVSRKFKKKDGERVEDTHFINCEAWDSGAEILGQYYKKGERIMVEGSLRTDSWEKDGQKRTSVFVRVNNFERAGAYKKDKDEQEAPQPVEEPTSFTPDDSVAF